MEKVKIYSVHISSYHTGCKRLRFVSFMEDLQHRFVCCMEDLQIEDLLIKSYIFHHHDVF